MLKIGYALILLVTVASTAVAAAPQNKQRYCLALGGFFETAASVRDSGLSPKQAYDILLGSELHPMGGKQKLKLIVSKAKLKRIVNIVYFNPGFTYAGGEALNNQVFNSCMGLHQYKPLR